MRIALDAMGGDFAPANPVAAAVASLQRFPQIQELHLFGDEALVRAELARHGSFPDSRLIVHHASQVIEMSDGAVEAIRRKKDSSLCRAVDHVKDGKADAIVSAGHTGALVAATTIKLRNLPGVDRAGIGALMPTGKNVFLLIDAGGNVDSKPDHLLNYGIMGSVFYTHILKQQSPRVGILCNGTEEGKGNELTREAFKLLKSAPINFIGNVEGHSLFDGEVDVVVCDGFVGNILLKSCENLAKSTFRWLKDELTSNPVRLAGAWLAKGAFQSIRKKTNADEYGGALLLGVNGVCVKAHGSSSVHALTNSLRVAAEAVELQVNSRIVTDVAKASASIRTSSPANATLAA